MITGHAEGTQSNTERTPAELLRLAVAEWLRNPANHHWLDGVTDLASRFRDNPDMLTVILSEFGHLNFTSGVVLHVPGIKNPPSLGTGARSINRTMEGSNRTTEGSSHGRGHGVVIVHIVHSVVIVATAAGIVCARARRGSGSRSRSRIRI